jgi:hypothetical protein
LIIAKGSYKKGQIFCQTRSYKKGWREYFTLDEVGVVHEFGSAQTTASARKLNISFTVKYLAFVSDYFSFLVIILPISIIKFLNFPNIVETLCTIYYGKVLHQSLLNTAKIELNLDLWLSFFAVRVLYYLKVICVNACVLLCFEWCKKLDKLKMNWSK